ncbi:hypothetical protein CC2G_003536 [Coprinopsis cinerea AmutBmut pab1-1]|nr:hypothetical protein CC2G_003536 [Coprinopsis cinerea AmutBmut pab1-1]
MAPPRKARHAAREPQPRRVVFTLRTVLYAIAFFLIFGLTVSELGLVSSQLHKYGEGYTNYPSKGYKHTLGLLLFSVIWSLLGVLGHPWLGIGPTAIFSFSAAVFFGVGAGLIHLRTPFQGHSCSSKPVEEYPVEWQPYAEECAIIVSIQGCAWALWALYIFLMVGTIVHKFDIRRRPTPEGFYHSKP